MTGLVELLARPVPALPLDLFRVLAGVLSFVYFLRTLIETPDFSGPRGLLDHRLTREILPPTRLSLFSPHLPAVVLPVAFILACLASALIITGIFIKPAAAYLFVVAVSTYRWNVLVAYVDDAIMHLVLFWLLLLPLGRTLVIDEWLADGATCFERWYAIDVPGFSTRCFLTNLALVYLVAGLYKWTSPMWRNGSALFAILKLPIAIAPSFWQQRHLPATRVLSYLTLLTEPLLPLMFVLPANSTAKWSAIVVCIAFHLGIVVTLQIPFANLAMLGAIPIALSAEWMQRPTSSLPLISSTLTDAAAASLVLALVSAVLIEIWRNGRWSKPPVWATHLGGFRRNPMCVLLWAFGISQNYRLFDWIDVRNYHVSYDVEETASSGSSGRRRLDPTTLFPRTIRHVLAQSYFLGNIWLRLASAERSRIATGILAAYARRFARKRGDCGIIEAYAILQRITPDNLLLERGERRLLMRFACRGGEAVIDEISLAFIETEET